MVYDNIQYTKKGWINRNRYLKNGKDAMFSLPLKKASDYSDVRDRQLADCFDKKKLLNQIRASYQKAPYFDQVFDLFCSIVNYSELNLFNYVFYSIEMLCDHLGLTTKLLISSSLDIDNALKAQEKVIAICNRLGAERYINVVGGKNLYATETFNNAGIELLFMEPKRTEYKQFDNHFMPWLSILDVLMFNSVDSIREQLT